MKESGRGGIEDETVKKKIYLFIWLHGVLVAAQGVFVASYRIFHCSSDFLVVVGGLSSCGTRA